MRNDNHVRRVGDDQDHKIYTAFENTTANNRKKRLIHIQIEVSEVPALCDTGASYYYSLMSKAFYEKMTKVSISPTGYDWRVKV